jgi:hypothetical protein
LKEWKHWSEKDRKKKKKEKERKAKERVLIDARCICICCIYVLLGAFISIRLVNNTSMANQKMENET